MAWFEDDKSHKIIANCTYTLQRPHSLDDGWALFPRRSADKPALSLPGTKRIDRNLGSHTVLEFGMFKEHRTRTGSLQYILLSADRWNQIRLLSPELQVIH